MNPDIIVAQRGHAGWITLNRPKVLNALTYEMCLALEQALDQWRDDGDIEHVVIEGAGERAFCAGGDVAQLFARVSAGDFAYGEQFWGDEYRLNEKIHHYPKPYIAFLQGYTMGGGVGVSCHGTHRIVGDTSRIAMPECSIGIVPDVGGSLLLAKAPGHLGEYLGTTGLRMGAGDAIYAGFADHYVPEDRWPGLKADLRRQSASDALGGYSIAAPDSGLREERHRIDRIFAHEEMTQIIEALHSEPGEFADRTLKSLSRASPLSLVCCLEVVRKVRERPSIERALDWEYRFVSRASQFGDFIEGVRAIIMDKDNSPRWRHGRPGDVRREDIAAMLAETRG